MERRVTVVMPVRNEAAYIEGAIRSVVRAGQGLEALEVLVVDGMSDDGTRELVTRLMAEVPGLMLLDNPEGTVPYAMNRGVRAASHDVVVRVDGHAEVYPGFLEECLAALEAHPECACVGGPIENVNLGPVAEAISLAMGSPFGVGNARFRTGGEDGYVDTLAFGAYRKADLLRVGLFDEELTRNQDDELNFRLLKAGRKIWFTNRIRSRYFVRGSYAKLWRQYFQYGYWKVYVNRKHGTVTNLRQLAPPAFVLWLALTLVAGLFWAPARWALLATLVAYAAAALAAALARTRSPAALLRVTAAFAVLHVAYGLGYLAGLRDFLMLGRRPSARSAELSR
ncbi:MAG TPA: glycosyltransferase family 2 protein [Trueperaceae bacterium]|nr:glycosyltransferase family 2 protein [Trueperaceae bacterium]